MVPLHVSLGWPRLLLPSGANVSAVFKIRTFLTRQKVWIIEGPVIAIMNIYEEQVPVLIRQQ